MRPKLSSALEYAWNRIWESSVGYSVLYNIYNGLFRHINYDPLRTYYIAPSDVQRTVGSIVPASPKQYHIEEVERPIEFPYCYGKVLDGNWDRQGQSVEDFVAFKSFSAHFEKGVPWERTEFYQRHLERIEEYSYSFGCKNEAELVNKLERYDDLATQLSSEDFASQRELREHPFRGINVALSREGKPLYFGHGRNRFLIAKIVGVDKIPVTVTMRHEKLLSPSTTRE